MIQLQQLTQYLQDLLELDAIPADPSNNGLQVEGTQKVSKAVFSVDASGRLFEQAVARKADFIFVHHGLSWGNGFKYLTGLDSRRMKLLLANGISLYAVHLPLDAHPRLGHNACIADMLKLRNRHPFAPYCGVNIGFMGELDKPASAQQLGKILDEKLDAQHAVYGPKRRAIRTIGVISGGSGTDGVKAAIDKGLDCLVTGEFGHSSYNYVAETGLTVITAGHYRTETPGVRTVMTNVKKKFKIDCEFVDLPTGL